MSISLPSGVSAYRAQWASREADAHGRGISVADLVEVIAAMRSDPAGDFRTETAATIHGVSPFAFIKAFKKLTGLSPQRFHAALRIDLAKQLLVSTDLSVTEVSLDVGYSSLGTFVRTFTLMVGLSPTQIRRFARGEHVEATILDVSNERRDPSNASLRAAIVNPPADRLLAAGLFPQSLPSGLPFDGCFVDPGSGIFELQWPAGHKVSLLAAAVSLGSMDEAWAGRFRSIHVCSQHVSPGVGNRTTIQLKLRPIEQTDPPFLTPVPLLMMLQSKRSTTTRVVSIAERAAILER